MAECFRNTRPTKSFIQIGLVLTTRNDLFYTNLLYGRQPWAVNAIAIEAGKYLLEKDPKMIPDLPAYLAEAQRLRQQLSALDGLKVMDTAAHFMLVNIDRGNVHDLKKWLVARYGILIREASNFRGLDNHYFRVTARTPEDDDRLVEALKAYLQSPED